MNLKIISAGAGSGKTYTLTQEMAGLLSPKDGKTAAVRASGIIATTFTNKAAAELKERVRIKLLEDGLSQQADELGNALIGTVHSIGVQLLKRFAFEAGVSPNVDIIADTDHQVIFNQSLSTVLPVSIIERMNQLSEKLGFLKDPRKTIDWRSEMRNLVNVARANNFDTETLERSKEYSIQSFLELLPPSSTQDSDYFDHRITQLLDETIHALKNNEDTTKGKQTLLGKLKGCYNAQQNRGFLNWYEWASLSKINAPKKSRDDVFELIEFAQGHLAHPSFRKDIITFINILFDTSIAAIQEYQSYKKARGLIDYTDMEVLILDLLENEVVLEVLKEEIDLLLVDEFQDTNPIQLQIFLKLTNIAKQAIWVGDPKQSIYGFRGAAPDLMEAVMKSTDNIANLPNSWRSRSDLVHLVNGLFVEAFDEMPKERIALIPAYSKADEATTNLQAANHHWHFQFEGNRAPKKPWTERCIARSLAELLEEQWPVRDKATKQMRPMKAADVAILCRSNHGCQAMADALYEEGLKASIARNGLLETAEASLLLACLRYILNKHDALSIAEILLLADQNPIQEILQSRLAYLRAVKDKTQEIAEEKVLRWGHNNDYIQTLRIIRHQSKELSASEILNWVVERLDIYRIMATWTNPEQRFANVDALRKFALDYEEACNRLHSAATLGGFLLWLDDLAKEQRDAQGSGESPDAVRVLTYHKSKGLEWPLVICHSLDQQLRDSIWGIRIIREVEEIDIQQPLANRLIGYWPNPYANQLAKTNLEEIIKAHPAFAIAQKAALEEEARVLYVGLTRARDYLVFPSVKKKATKWLNRVYHHGNEDLPALDIHSNELPWLWESDLIPIQNKTFNYEKNLAPVTPSTSTFDYFTPRVGLKEHQAAELELASLIKANDELKIGKVHQYTKALVLDEEKVDYLTLQSIFKAFILADRLDYDKEIRLQIAQELLEQHELEDEFRVQDLLYHSQAYYQYLHQNFAPESVQSRYNFADQKEGQILRTNLDMVLTAPKQLVIINSIGQQIQKPVQQKSKMREDIALLQQVAHSLKAKLQKTNSLQLIWQPLEGKLIETAIQSTVKQANLFG